MEGKQASYYVSITLTYDNPRQVSHKCVTLYSPKLYTNTFQKMNVHQAYTFHHNISM